MLPDSFGMFLPVVVNGAADDLASRLELASVLPKSWPNRNRRKLADEEEWMSQSLSKEWPLEMKRGQIRP